MSKLVRRIEKEFFLKAMYDEQLPVSYYRDRENHIMFLALPPEHILIFRLQEPWGNRSLPKTISLTFSFHGVPMLFHAGVIEARGFTISCGIPEEIRKNLDREHARVALPEGASAHISFWGDRYSLAFPRLRRYHSVRTKPADIATVKEQTERLAKARGYSYRLSVFENRPEAPGREECILAHTGKTIFLARVNEGFPKKETGGKNRTVTQDVYRRYLLETSGIGDKAAQTAEARFFHEKLASGVVSDVWVPILFQEYTVGCIRMWHCSPEKNPIDCRETEILYRFADAVAHELKEKGVFNKMRLADGPFPATVQDISASGILFTCPSPDICLKLMPDCELKITLSGGQHGIDLRAVINRVYREGPALFIGCRFRDMQARDIAGIFEFLYSSSQAS